MSGLSRGDTYVTEANYWTPGHLLTRRRILRSAASGSAALAAAALIGCGSSKDTKPAASSNPAQTGAGSAPASVAVKTSGRLAWEINGDPVNFDLHVETSNLTNRTAGPAYNQLVQFDPKITNEPPTAMIPDLATQWEVAPDGMTYSFKLVKNAKFHDGTPMTSEDVKASLERIQNVEAKKLIAAAGVRDGQKVTILARTSARADASLFVADQLKKLGIDAKVDGVEASTERERLARFAFELYVKSGQSNALDDPDSIFGDSYLSSSPRNYARLKNPTVDALYLSSPRNSIQNGGLNWSRSCRGCRCRSSAV